MVISGKRGIIINMSNPNRQKLIELLKQGLAAEEKAVPIYNRHLESAVFWLGLSEDRAATLKYALEILAKESTAHKMTVDKILVKLCKGE